MQLSYQQNIPSGSDLTLFPDSRGFEENSEALNYPDEIRLGHCKSDALCGAGNPSVDWGPVLFGSEWMPALLAEKMGIAQEITKI